MTLRCKSSCVLGLLKPLLFLQQITEMSKLPLMLQRHSRSVRLLFFCIVDVHRRCCLEHLGSGNFCVSVAILEK